MKLEKYLPKKHNIKNMGIRVPKELYESLLKTANKNNVSLQKMVIAIMSKVLDDMK